MREGSIWARPVSLAVRRRCEPNTTVTRASSRLLWCLPWRLIGRARPSHWLQVKCDKHFPCARCVRRGIRCVPQPRSHRARHRPSQTYSDGQPLDPRLLGLAGHSGAVLGGSMQQMFTVPSSQPALAAIASSFAPGLLERHLAEMNPWINADPLLAQAPDLTCSLRHAPADSHCGLAPHAGLTSSTLAPRLILCPRPHGSSRLGRQACILGFHVSVAAHAARKPASAKSGLRNPHAEFPVHAACMAVPATNDETGEGY